MISTSAAVLTGSAPSASPSSIQIAAAGSAYAAITQAPLASLPTGRPAASEAAEFAPQGECDLA